jgi:hypothetical protein
MMQHRPFEVLHRTLHALRLRAVADLNSWWSIPDPIGWSPRPLKSDALVDVDGYRMYAADGSAGTFYARLLVVPSHDVAFAGFVNSGAGEPARSRAIGSLTGLPW